MTSSSTRASHRSVRDILAHIELHHGKLAALSVLGTQRMRNAVSVASRLPLALVINAGTCNTIQTCPGQATAVLPTRLAHPLLVLRRSLVAPSNHRFI